MEQTLWVQRKWMPLNYYCCMAKPVARTILTRHSTSQAFRTLKVVLLINTETFLYLTLAPRKKSLTTPFAKLLRKELSAPLQAKPGNTARRMGVAPTHVFPAQRV